MNVFFVGLGLLGLVLTIFGGLMFGAWASEKILSKFDLDDCFPFFLLLGITITGLTWSSIAGIVSSLGG